MNDVEFDAFVRDYRPQLVRSAYRQLDRWADAEDAVQGALVTAWEKRDQYDADAPYPFIAWVHTILKRQVLQMLAERRRYVPVGGWESSGFEFVAQPPESNTGLSLNDPETMDRVRSALKTLRPAQRQAVELHCIDGLTPKEVAQRLGKSRHAVHQLLHMAFKDRDWSGPEYHTTHGVESREAKLFRKQQWLLHILPAWQQRVIQLRYIEGLSGPETAARLGMREHTVYNSTRMARATLNKKLAELVSA